MIVSILMSLYYSLFLASSITKALLGWSEGISFCQQGEGGGEDGLGVT